MDSWDWSAIGTHVFVYKGDRRLTITETCDELNTLTTKLEAAEAKNKEMISMLEKPDCEWWQEKEYYMDRNCWDTTCGHVHEFISGGPKDNEYKFCPYCGGEIKSRAK